MSLMHVMDASIEIKLDAMQSIGAFPCYSQPCLWYLVVHQRKRPFVAKYDDLNAIHVRSAIRV